MLAGRMLQHAVSNGLASVVDQVELCVWPSPDHVAFAALHLPRGIGKSSQQGADLGERMAHAMQQGLSRWDRVLIMGTDAPALNASVIDQAIVALNASDIVLVPAVDGGFALIGSRCRCDALFTGVAWSTGQVLRQTLMRASEAGLSVRLLDAVVDIDEPDDLEHVPKAWLEQGIGRPDSGSGY